MIMNEKNFSDLKHTLEYLGFGRTLNASLRNCIEFELPRFRMTLDLKMPVPNPKNRPDHVDVVQYQLEISKESGTDKYSFDRYDIYLQPAIKPYEMRNQRFYIKKGEGITVKESYNLLCGRAVNKDVVLKNGEKANMWFKLDLSERDPEKGYAFKKYDYNLVSTVEGFVFQGIDRPGFKEQLLKSLNRGNLHEVTFLKDGKEIMGFIAANPKFKTLDFYDLNLVSVYSKAVGINEASTKALISSELKEAAIKDTSAEKKTGRGR